MKTEAGELMNQIPPAGFRLVKKREPVREGDLIMTSFRPGEWRGPVPTGHELIGSTAEQIGESTTTTVKVARKQ